MLPLSKQKLRNLIGDESNWAETPGTYKQLVNDRVFQFRDIRQYEQLIQLLIKVRTPKLSKESFRPSEVKKILNESLQVLTDEDPFAMVSTMERMDALEDTLRDFQTALRDAAIIRNEYSRYNQYILGRKGQAYLQAHNNALRLRNQLQDAKEALEQLEQEFRDQAQKQKDAESLFQQAKANMQPWEKTAWNPSGSGWKRRRPHAASLRSSWQRRDASWRTSTASSTAARWICAKRSASFPRRRTSWSAVYVSSMGKTSCWPWGGAPTVCQGAAPKVPQGRKATAFPLPFSRGKNTLARCWRVSGSCPKPKKPMTRPARRWMRRMPRKSRQKALCAWAAAGAAGA